MPEEREKVEAGPQEQDAAAAESGAEEAADRMEADLEALLEDTKRERDEYLELAQRTRADFENYRKRMTAEARDAAGRGRATLAAELIGVIDNLERALAAAQIDPAKAQEGEVPLERALEQGALLTYRELSAILKRAGVESYDPAGERFDPSWHEALQTRSQDGAEPGTVLEVLQRGYRLNGQVLRAARVVVSD
ncbi:MAG TPA: nucleotide exchange factor GrpE [Solirubrobacterales bacterium]|nr:nucleotide exchange factor GrpE [Solirubrobacterales bacterium]